MKNCRGNHKLYRVEDLECFLAYIPKACFLCQYRYHLPFFNTDVTC